ncbi:hypothetical protein [Paenibacillus sp. FSL R5-0378]
MAVQMIEKVHNRALKAACEELLLAAKSIVKQADNPSHFTQHAKRLQNVLDSYKAAEALTVTVESLRKCSRRQVAAVLNDLIGGYQMSLAIYFRETMRTKKLYICHLIDNGAKNAKITILRDVFGDLPKDTKTKAPLDWRAIYVRIDRPFKNKMMEAPAEKIEEMMLKAHRRRMQKKCRGTRTWSQ